ncbi:MAG TPA: ornithine carbamoyltransferase [Bacillota bacterium]
MSTMEVSLEKMSVNDSLAGRDFLTLADYTSNELNDLLELAAHLKRKQKLGHIVQPLKGKVLGMIFEKPSTRTRISFETGMYQLGGHAIFLSTDDIQLGRGETIADTAKVLSTYLDSIMIRTFSQCDVEELAEHASIPVINGLTDLFHPCQVLADLQTIREQKGSLMGVKMAYIGDGNNMSHSLMIGAAMMGMDICVATPEQFSPHPDIVNKALQIADSYGGRITQTTSPEEAVQEADVVYTDVWTSMGQEAEQEEREKAFTDFQVNQKLLSQARPQAIFMHCLPAQRGVEVTAEVIDGEQSVVFQQAENRLHAQKALLTSLMS